MVNKAKSRGGFIVKKMSKTGGKYGLRSSFSNGHQHAGVNWWHLPLPNYDYVSLTIGKWRKT